MLKSPERKKVGTTPRDVYALTLAAHGSVADRLAARREEFAARLAALTSEAVPEVFAGGDPAAIRVMARQLRANFEHAVHRVRLAVDNGELVPTDVDGLPPIQTAAGARFAARAGIPLATLKRAYRLAHRITWEMLAEEIVALQLPADALTTTLQVVWQSDQDFFHQLGDLITTEYGAEAAVLARDREQKRAAALDRVLKGELRPDLEADLGYTLDGWHVAAVINGTGAVHHPLWLGSTWRRQLLMVDRDCDTVWAWMGASREPDADDLRSLVDGVPDHCMAAAFGEPASGPDGFRLTHSQALRTQRVADMASSRAARYVDVAPIAAIVEDPVARRSLVRLYLREFAGDEDRHEALRDTLRAYFATGQNAASAAAKLGVRDKTVANRLRAIEDQLGPLTPQRVGLELALRLHELEQHEY